MDMDIEKILSDLNESQKEAVFSTEGYVRVIAGAGSGKTRALTARYAYLVEEIGISPANILCVTFTNKAAREMKLRLRQLLGDGIETSFVSTLHAFCTRVLREDISRLFYPENFVILDTSDQKSILEEIYEELGIKMDTATFEYMINKKIRTFKNKILYSNYMVDPREAIGSFNATETEKKVIVRYMEKQKKYFGLDFFDIINFTVHLFKIHENTLNKWQDRLHYVMFDEFQDINNKELRLIHILTDIHQNLFVVGDPDQNIYEWRAAKMEFLLKYDEFIKGYFTDTYPLPTYWPDHVVPPLKSGFKTIFLNQNYRSTPEILNASNSLIEKNKNRIKKELFTKNASGLPTEHFHGKNDADEIKYIVENILSHTENGGRYTDIAVLYRSSYISRFIEQGFLKYNIPYIVYGGIGFYERKEIKDVLSYMRLVAYGDDLSLLRILNVPRRKIGKNKIAFIRNFAVENNTTLYESLKLNIETPDLRDCGAKKFVSVIEEAKDAAVTLQVSELLQKLLIDTGYEQYVRESGEMDRLDNVSELIRSIISLENDYGEPLTLATFLQDAALHLDLEEDKKNDCVKIMTAHTAKGLEFHTVIVAGLSEKIFPSARALEERREEALEEERRLAYVAMTRAKQRLYMSESEGFGFRGYTKTPSRFLFDISNEHIVRIGNIGEEIMKEHALQIASRKPSAVNQYAAGDKVKHKSFGEGVIESLDEKTKTYMIRFSNGVKPIRFDYHGLSQVI